MITADALAQMEADTFEAFQALMSLYLGALDREAGEPATTPPRLDPCPGDAHTYLEITYVPPSQPRATPPVDADAAAPLARWEELENRGAIRFGDRAYEAVLQVEGDGGGDEGSEP